MILLAAMLAPAWPSPCTEPDPSSPYALSRAEEHLATYQLAAFDRDAAVIDRALACAGDFDRAAFAQLLRFRATRWYWDNLQLDRARLYGLTARALEPDTLPSLDEDLHAPFATWEAGTAMLRVEGAPEDSTVWLDGASFTGERVGSGAHLVQVRTADERVAWGRIVLLRDGERRSLVLPSSGREESSAGQLRIRLVSAIADGRWEVVDDVARAFTERADLIPTVEDHDLLAHAACRRGLVSRCRTHLRAALVAAEGTDQKGERYADRIVALDREFQLVTVPRRSARFAYLDKPASPTAEAALQHFATEVARGRGFTGLVPRGRWSVDDVEIVLRPSEHAVDLLRLVRGPRELPPRAWLALGAATSWELRETQGAPYDSADINVGLSTFGRLRVTGRWDLMGSVRATLRPGGSGWRGATSGSAGLGIGYAWEHVRVGPWLAVGDTGSPTPGIPDWTPAVGLMGLVEVGPVDTWASLAAGPDGAQADLRAGYTPVGSPLRFGPYLSGAATTYRLDAEPAFRLWRGEIGLEISVRWERGM